MVMSCVCVFASSHATKSRLHGREHRGCLEWGAARVFSNGFLEGECGRWEERRVAVDGVMGGAMGWNKAAQQEVA